MLRHVHTLARSARLTAAPLLLLAAAPAQRSPETRVDRAPAGTQATAPQMAAFGRSVYLVWQDDRNGSGDIFFNRSNDAGKTWMGQDVRLDTSAAGSSDSRNPQIAVNGARLIVTWVDERSGSFDVYCNRSLDGGATWLAADVRINSISSRSATTAPRPRAIAAGGFFYVLWDDYRLANADVYFNRSRDATAGSWLANDIRLDVGSTIGSAASLFPQLATSGALGQSVFATWADRRDGQFDIYFSRSLDSGANWLSPDVRLDVGSAAGAALSGVPQIATSGGAVYVVWADARDGETDIYFNRSLDNGTTWLDPDVRLDTDAAGAAASGQPQLAASGDAVYVVWSDSRNGETDVYFNRSLDRGGSFLGTDVRLDTDAAGAAASTEPQIAAAGDHLYVAWTEGRNPTTDLYYNRSANAGANWLPDDVALDTSATQRLINATAPQVAATGPYVAWQAGTASGQAVYFNIPFGFQTYGNGNVGAGGQVPQMGGSGLAIIGGPITLDVANAVGGAPGAMFLGAGPSSRTALPIQQGTLQVIPLITLGFGTTGPAGVPGIGKASIPLTLPSNPVFVGANINLQAWIVDDQSPTEFAHTGGLELWIG
ncbi:MAG: sialidase family protein [Planctomycetota bacterium]